MKVFRAVCYERLHEIGVGQGMNSTVWLSRDLNGGRTLAVKEIDRTTIHDDGWAAYHREAQVMHASRHDHVVPILYACMTEDRICLAMPYYAAGSLQDRIEEGPLPLAEAYRISHGILSALSQIHVAGVLHFDLKPSNVLFSDRDEPLVADFGQARLIDPLGTSPLPSMYENGVPPEFFSGGLGSVETDVYHAGLTLYRIFNGDPLWDEQLGRLRLAFPEAVQRGRFPRREAFLPHVPAGIRRVIRRALQVDPSDRYHSATEFQDALGRVPLPANWETHPRPDGGYMWRTQRKGRPRLEVHQVPSAGGQLWDVEVYTRRGASVRRRGLADLWADGLSAGEATRHLRTVFTALESD